MHGGGRNFRASQLRFGEEPNYGMELEFAKKGMILAVDSFGTAKPL
jgi:hypothetical protein